MEVEAEEEVEVEAVEVSLPFCMQCFGSQAVFASRVLI